MMNGDGFIGIKKSCMITYHKIIKLADKKLQVFHNDIKNFPGNVDLKGAIFGYVSD